MDTRIIPDPHAPQPPSSAPVFTIVSTLYGSAADRDVVVVGQRDAGGELLRVNDGPLTPSAARALLARLETLAPDAVADLTDALRGITDLPVAAFLRAVA